MPRRSSSRAADCLIVSAAVHVAFIACLVLCRVPVPVPQAVRPIALDVNLIDVAAADERPLPQETTAERTPEPLALEPLPSLVPEPPEPLAFAVHLRAMRPEGSAPERFEKIPEEHSAAPASVSVARVDTPPEPLGVLRPVYPRTARRRGEEGCVTVVALVDAAGRIGEVRIDASSGFADLDAAALEAVREATFKPATAAGRAVAADVRLTLAFKLTR